GTFTPRTTGAHSLVYEAADSFGNKGTSVVSVNVGGGKAGNVLGQTSLTIGPGTKGGYTEQYIYDEKVSMIVNVSNHGLIQFNMRGPVGANQDWPDGMILRVAGPTVTVSSYSHDKLIFGQAPNPFAADGKLGVDALLEFQVVNVIVSGVEYIKVRIWFQSEELTWSAAGNGGMIGIEDGSQAIYRRVSDFNGKDAYNIYAGPFWVSSYSDLNGSITIKELRIDGSSCTKPGI
ncbi:MAG: hypothetical protein FWF01_04645, partial [Alphaproteobacteria bacterium]|nr:hypothetical protein [Alphaproteobacteria bacterium]